MLLAILVILAVVCFGVGFAVKWVFIAAVVFALFVLVRLFVTRV